MSATGRVYSCARCHQQVVICSHCDCGNRYCADGCAETARRESLRRAGGRFQASRRGRFLHAARQRRYRQRQAQRVTHQGSPPAPADVLLSRTSHGDFDYTSLFDWTPDVCAFCATAVTPMWPTNDRSSPDHNHPPWGSEP